MTACSSKDVERPSPHEFEGDAGSTPAVQSLWDIAPGEARVFDAEDIEEWQRASDRQGAE
jgi:hypothetical protein